MTQIITNNSGGGGGTNPERGDIQGTLSDQTDLQTALDGKVNLGANTEIDGTYSYTAYYMPEHTIHTVRDDTDSGDDLEIYAGGIAHTTVSNGIGTIETYTFNEGTNDDIARKKDLSVVSGDSGTTYEIKVANSDPASGTASNIITFVL